MRGPAPHARSPQAPPRPRGSSGGIRSAPHRLAEADSTSRSPLLKSWAISARRTAHRSATGRSRPVDVAQVEPEGELVERQSHADPEADRAQLAPGRPGHEGDGDVAEDEHRQDAPDE